MIRLISRFFPLLLILVLPVFLVAQPVVDLGPDTVLCGGSIVLDAGNPGATYLWSTGATSQTITVSASDTFWVDVTNGGTTRDSVGVWVLTTPATPVIGDSSICGAGTVTLAAQNNGGRLYWYDGSGINLVGAGNTFSADISQTSTFYVESKGAVPGFVASDFSFGGFFALVDNRGVFFNAKASMILESVEIPVQGSLAATIELYDPQNTLIYSKPVSLSDGANLVWLGFEIPRGNGYRMMLANLSGGGSTSVRLPTTYPISFSHIEFTAGTPISNHYNYFYNWQIALLNEGCGSSRDSSIQSLFQTPPIELGNDTALCGISTFDLDASTVGGVSYLWNTGAISQILAVDSSGTYEVVVTDANGCTASDQVFIGLYDLPLKPNVADTVNCGGGEISLVASNNGGTVFWLDETGEEVLAIGDTLTTVINSPTEIRVEARGIESGFGAGLTNQGNFFAIVDSRGLIFDVNEPILIESVLMPITGTVNGTIELYDGTNTLIASKAVSLLAGNNEVILGFELPRGTDYRLMLTNISGGGSTAVSLPVTYPFVYPQVEIKAGTPIANHYNFFYDWKIARGGNCVSAEDTISITIGALPNLELGNDTIVCGTPDLLLDGENPGSEFLWSTGDTTQTITIDSLGTYSLQVTAANGCSITDSIFAAFADAPGVPIVNDTTVCGVGMVQLNAINTGGTLFWYDSTGAVLEIGDEINLDLQDSTEVFVQSLGIVPGFTAGSLPSGNYFAIVDDRGLVFDVLAPIIVESVSVYVIGDINADVELYDASNTLLETRPVSLSEGVNEVLLGFEIQRGTDYRMMLANLSGGGSLRVNIGAAFPYTTSTVVVKSGVPIPEHYNYFHSWKVSIGGSCETPIQAVAIDVNLPFNLTDSIYSCSDTLLDISLPGANYAWSTGASTSSISVSVTGIYSVLVDDGAGCLVADTTFVEIPQNAGLADDGILCGNVLTTNYGSDATFLWNNGAVTPELSISSPGTYSVVVNEPRGCVLTDTIVVSGFDTFPVVSLGADFSACDSTTLDLGNPGLQYQWSTGDTTQVITVSSSGQYVGTVINVNQCATSDTLNLFISNSPNANFSTTYVTDFQIFFNNLTVPFSTYVWAFGDGTTSTSISPSHTYADTGTYIVQLIATNSCGNDTFTQEVIVVDSSVGLEPYLEGPELHIFPNPSATAFTIEWNGEVGPWEIFLIDPLGREWFRQHIFAGNGIGRESINVRDLPNGLYIVRLENGSLRSEKLLQVQH